MEGSTSGKKYQATLLIPKQGLSESDKAAFEQMRKLAGEAARKKWPQGVPKTMRSPFRDGDERFAEKDGACPEYQGMIYVSFKCPEDRPPQIVDQRGNKITEEMGKIYPGCWVRVSYGAYGYDASGNKGVAFSLNNVQFIRDDESFDSRTSAEQDFGAPQGSAEGSDDMFGDGLPF